MEHPGISIMLTHRHISGDVKDEGSILFKNKTLSQYCSPEKSYMLMENMRCINYRKGEVIFHEGQPSFLIYFISSGVVKLWKEGLHKEGQIIRFAKEGDMIGFWGSLENRNYTLSATAISDSRLCYIKKDVFLPIIQANSSLHLILHDYIKELKKMEDDLRNMAEMNVREKVAHSLLVLLNLFKNNLDEEAYKIVLSRKEISALSAICEDRVSKQLSDFRKENIITIHDNSTSIDQRALQQIINPYIAA